MLTSWVSVNPSYEYILFDDDDMEDFVCENFENVSVPFSQIVAGASKTDVWRGFVCVRRVCVVLPLCCQLGRERERERERERKRERDRREIEVENGLSLLSAHDDFVWRSLCGCGSHRY